jgi:hypothetical protein
MVGRPPLGLIPRYIHEERRYEDVRSAIMERLAQNYPVPPEWIKEYNDLLQRIDSK